MPVLPHSVVFSLRLKHLKLWRIELEEQGFESMTLLTELLRVLVRPGSRQEARHHAVGPPAVYVTP